MKALLARLSAARDGSAAIELGLLAPTMCALLLGVLHIGIAMHDYNALRGIAADVARYAVVQYQAADGNNPPSNSAIQQIAKGMATLPPYGLDEDDLQITVANAGVQRVPGAKELTITITYNIDSLLTVIGLEDFEISIERPIFVLES